MRPLLFMCLFLMLAANTGCIEDCMPQKDWQWWYNACNDGQSSVTVCQDYADKQVLMQRKNCP